MEETIITYSVFTLYLIVNIFFSIIYAPAISLIPIIFLAYWTLHLSYGIGFIWGMIRFMDKWGDKLLRDDHFNRKQFIANSSVTL